MNYNDDNLDLVEEIYLTQEQANQWFSPNTQRSFIFKLEGKKVALKDMYPTREVLWPPLIRSHTDVMIEQSLNWAAKFSGRYTGTMGKTLNVPRAKRAKKPERPCDAVWTLSRYEKMAICIHDEGFVVAMNLARWTTFVYIITPQGHLYCDAQLQDDAYLAMPHIQTRLGLIRDGVRLWVKRAKGRKTPQGFRRLWKRFPKADGANLPS
jgi:hypothetical protein